MARTRFRFDLDPVLALRERAVEAAQEVLGRTLRRRIEAESALAAAVASQAEGLGAMGRGAQTAAGLAGSAVHRGTLAADVRKARQAVALAAADERRARAALAEALRQREALDVLRTEAVETHRADALRAETATLDDLASGSRPSPLSG